MASSELRELVVSKISEGDVVHKVFLKPMELVLRTHNVAPGVDSRGLPQGVMHALKPNGIQENPFEPLDIPLLNKGHSLERTRADNADNLISFLKHHNTSEGSKGLELALCVCMYSENRTMLKDTIKGIEDNVANLIKSGVHPDSIAVFVIMDGIEKVDPSVVGYFQELERESHIYLGENSIASYTAEDIAQQIRQRKTQEFSASQFVEKNMNNFLFNQSELEDLESRRFASVHAEYLQLKRIRGVLLKLQSNKKVSNLYEELPERIKQDFWLPLAQEYHQREQKKKRGSLIEEGPLPTALNHQQLIEKYSGNANGRVIATEAINKAVAFIDKYVATRDELCYVGSFRKKISLGLEGRENVNRRDDRQGLYEQSQGEQRCMNLFMCVKYKNAGKLSSHNWFFNGFCRELSPAFTVLMDVGLKPAREAVFRMYSHMKANPNVGGVCGYMRLKIEQVEDEEEVREEEVDWLSGALLGLVDIQKAQQMEYNLAHVIDKPFEAAFGFIHVLPGAFSGYNMRALGADDDGRLLKEYFRSIEEKLVQDTVSETELSLGAVLLRVLLPQALFSIFVGVAAGSEEEMLYNENIYFAEDRILCMEIHKNGLDLVYLPDALAEVDPIKTVHGLMGQRKRWINGSYFAFEKVKKEIGQTKQCELSLRAQVLFYDFLNILIYFAPAIFFFTIHISMKAFRDDVLVEILRPIQTSSETNKQLLDFFVYTIDLIYAITLTTVIYYSLNSASNKPIFKPYIYLASTVLGLMALSVLVVYLVDIVRGLTTGSIFLVSEGDGGQSDEFKTILMVSRWIMVGVFGIYIVPLLTYAVLFRSMRPLVEGMKNALSFIFYNPTYFIILSFYALCRIDDISWGTKGLNQQGSGHSKLQEKWRLIKLIHVGKYTFWNIVGSVLLLSFSQLYYPRFYISFVIMILIVVTIGLKILIGFAYLISYKLKNCCKDAVTHGSVAQRSSMSTVAKVYGEELKSEILQRANGMGAEMGRGRRGGSYIMAMKSFTLNPKVNRNDAKKFKIQNEGRSKIERKGNLKAIREEN